MAVGDAQDLAHERLVGRGLHLLSASPPRRASPRLCDRSRRGLSGVPRSLPCEAEAQAGECDRADEHIAAAKGYAAQKTGGNLDERLSNLESLVDLCRSDGTDG